MLREFKNKVASVELIPSSGGVFEVTAGGNLIFSKKEQGRFPNEGEVEEKIGQLVGA